MGEEKIWNEQCRNIPLIFIENSPEILFVDDQFKFKCYGADSEKFSYGRVQCKYA